MRKLKYSQGMTLIEVLIASVILFIAVSVMSFVARSSSLHEKRLIDNIDYAILAEFIKDEVSYQYQYENKSQGSYKVGASEYQWRAEVVEAKAPIRYISSEFSGESNPQGGELVLYEIKVSLNTQKKQLMSFKDVYWKN